MVSECSDGTITIRKYLRTDLDAIFQAAVESVADVYPWLPWCHPGYQREEAEGWLAYCDDAWLGGREYNFAILDAMSGQFLGGCGLNQIRREADIANLGYWVRSSATRRGVATAATRLTARFGFEEANMHRIEIIASVRNLASRKVAENVGAVYEGVLRNRLLLHGERHAAAIYSLIPGDPL